MHKRKKVIVIPFIFSFLIVLAVSLYANILISFSMHTMEYNMERRLIAESRRLAGMVSSAELEKYRAVKDMKLPEYKALRRRMLDFSIEADVLYVYYIRQTDSGFQYIVDNDFNEKTRVGLDTPPFDPLTVPWIMSAQQGQAGCSGLGNYNIGWEGLLSAYAPIFDEDGNVTAIAGVDIKDGPILRAWRLASILTVVQFITVAAIFVSGIIYLIYLYRQLKIAREASSAKSDFLAKMSHEIRTPMNAITGMAELALREDMPQTVYDHIITIKQAGNNLVSIINDILDFSKIEAGKLEIIPVNYMLSSLINDTVNIIRTRIMEKPLRFFTNIDSNIPNSLIGDEMRLRQILINLLSNAVKYSEKGHIGLTITMDKRDDKQVWLRIAVSDTGKGIKPEDQEKLFDEFVQVDISKRQNVEGTGLGLSITKLLCIAMGGDISMKSEYGKGSVFTVIIPQGIETDAPFAAVEEPEKKKVLVYEGRIIYANAISWSLENMGVPFTMVTNHDDFASALYREEWFHVFSGYGLYEKIAPIMESGEFSNGKKPPLALMVEWGTEPYISGVRFVSIPAQSLSIANVLNGKEDIKGYIKNSGAFRFTFPDARILVVDDISTNLKVVEGLLAPYLASVDTCLNGLKAIELVKQKTSENLEYDIIFMDHMMPEMDGVETTSVIRLWEKERAQELGIKRKQIPIIALTANAVMGMREMFIENGFNDFLSKPIDVSKLDEMLDRWLPKEKRGAQESTASSGVDENGQQGGSPNNGYSNNIGGHALAGPVGVGISIPGVDVQKGIVMTGGTMDGYMQVLSLFCKDAQDRLPLLQKPPEATKLDAFITQVHALKSASASIGAHEISIAAAGLETAGKAGDAANISKNLPDFTEQLTELVKNIHTALEQGKPESQDTLQDSDTAEPYTPLLKEQLMEDEKKLIILVDDNLANLKIGNNFLEEKYTVATAPSAAKMFSLLKNNTPAIILLDVDMPEMNGYEAIKILKSNPETKNIPVIFLTAKSESEDELEGLSLGAIDYITKPFNPVLLLKRIEVHLLLEGQRKELQYFNENLQKMVEEKTESILNMQNALLKTMAELVEYRDDITGGHIERTQRGIKIMLEEIGKSGVYREETKGWDVDLLLQSSQLHDVGKISISDSILKKPGKLTDEEFSEMKKHATFGEQIIEKIETLTKESDFLKYAKIFAASHHERWDGKGYPRGLKENEIALLGRIMAIADVYDALTSVRPYKRAFSHEEAVRIITEGSGTQFDPQLVEVFRNASEQFET